MHFTLYTYIFNIFLQMKTVSPQVLEAVFQYIENWIEEQNDEFKRAPQ